MPHSRPRYRAAELVALEDAERQVASDAVAKSRRRGYIATVNDLYPGMRLPSSVGYTRQGVPLLPLALLYEKLVVYVPPIDRPSLQTRWGTTYEDFVELVRCGIIQPLVGHIPDYRSSHFRDLFESGTPVPSVWTRGLTALTELGLGDALRPDRYSFDLEELSVQPSLVAKFKRHFPRYSDQRLHRRIRTELLTNLADLALFGEHEIIDDLERVAPSLPPDDLARTILLLSEVRAYPILFGLGGTANYDARLSQPPMLGEGLEWAIAHRDHRHVKADRYGALLKGIGIDVSTLAVDDVLEFHGSNDARLLRKAVAAFEREAQKAAASTTVGDLDPLLSEATELDSLLTAATRELRSPAERKRYDRTVSTSSWVLQVGGVALGGWVGLETTGTPFGAVGGAALFKAAVVDPTKTALTNALVARRFRPGVANLWRLRRRRTR